MADRSSTAATSSRDESEADEGSSSAATDGSITSAAAQPKQQGKGSHSPVSPRTAARVRAEIARKRAEIESLRGEMAALQVGLQELADGFRRDMQATIAEAIARVSAASTEGAKSTPDASRRRE